MTALIAAALALLEDCSDHQTPITKIKAARRLVNAAAWERLRLSRIPCETCGGNGEHFMEPQVFDRTARCPSCGGSGEVWPAELQEVAAEVIRGFDRIDEDAIARAVSDDPGSELLPAFGVIPRVRHGDPPGVSSGDTCLAGQTEKVFTPIFTCHH